MFPPPLFLHASVCHFGGNRFFFVFSSQWSNPIAITQPRRPFPLTSASPHYQKAKSEVSTKDRRRRLSNAEGDGSTGWRLLVLELPSRCCSLKDDNSRRRGKHGDNLRASRCIVIQLSDRGKKGNDNRRTKKTDTGNRKLDDLWALHLGMGAKNRLESEM